MCLMLIHMKSSSTYSFICFPSFLGHYVAAGDYVALLFLLLCCVQSIQSCPIFVTSRTVAHQAHLSMGFSRQEYCNGLPYPPPGDLPNPPIEPVAACISCIKVDSLPTEPPGKPFITIHYSMIYVSILPLIVI